ncbi:MAG: mechanosensitive ion channel family protein [Phycisphaerales bacterium]|jgi:small conductance mechanosensitive channel
MSIQLEQVVASEGLTQESSGSATEASSIEASASDDPSATVMETLQSIWEGFLSHLPLLVAGLLIVVVTLVVGLVARWISRRLLSGVKMRDSLKELVVRFVVIGVWAVGLMISAMVMFPGLTPTKALTALGVGSIAIGLAFKDIFENFFAGVLILWRFPFENGDWISCNGITGRVVNVTVRNTILRTVRGELVVVPNVDIYKNPVDVLTDRAHRRLEIIVGVAYGEDVAESRKVIEEAVRGCETIQARLGVQVFAQEFASSSVNFEVAWWTGATPVEQRKSRDEVVEAIKRALDDAGIEIPFPYRTLTFKQPLEVEQQGKAEAEGDEA